MPKDAADPETLSYEDIIPNVLTTTDIEFFLKFSEPVRAHDQIIIEFPSDNDSPWFNLASLTTDAVWSEYAGDSVYKDDYIMSDETWNTNKFYG